MSEQTPKDLYIQVGNIKTRYWETGDDGFPIVLIHGLGGCIENWELNMEILSKRHHVYAVDLVGCGLTEKPSVRYSIPYLANFVQDFMAQKNIENSCLIGHSIGAGIAIDMYLTNPARIDRLILVDGFGFGKKLALQFRILAIPIIGEQLMKPNRDGLIRFFKMLFYDHTLITDELVNFSSERSSLPGSAEAYLTTLRAHANFFGLKNGLLQRMKEDALRITVPTKIIWGKEDKAIPVEQAYIATKILPNNNLHIIDKCGHVPQVECAEEFNWVVSDFLSQ
jgi:4,5:9,10-diseco-3-hydroxy-5,9,17-trioxoandrosta-1(10),2-diene-4-oate hydrolase